MIHISMTIDYSKWDTLTVSSSDDESHAPVVTKFDKPQSVTIGTQKATESSNKEYNEKTPNRQEQPLYNINNYCTNGSIVNDSYVWGQTRLKLHALISLPNGIKGKNLNVIVTKESLSINNKLSTETLLDKKFSFSVHDEFDYYNWEILSHSKFVANESFNKLFKDKTIFEINLTKLEKFDSISTWWPSLFKEDPEIDVQSLEGRNKDNKTFMDNWKEANRLFKDKVANFKKIELN